MTHAFWTRFPHRLKITIAAAVLWTAGFGMASAAAQAAVEGRTIEYRHGDTVLEGYLAYDDAVTGKRPGVLVVHEWMGLGANAKAAADRLAGMGYTALAVDMYGKGVRPQNQQEAAEQASIYKGDRPLMRARIGAGLETLRGQETVDPTRIAAIGYCFGGTTVLELARGGEDVRGVVSFHGGLSTPSPASADTLKAKVLALHGAEDPYVPAPEVQAFEDEMRAAKADWQLVKYSGAVHSFTNPEAGSDPSKGAAYNASADRRSWIAMQDFLKELFS